MRNPARLPGSCGNGSGPRSSVTDANIVRAMYDALAAADIPTFVALLDPEVEWTVPGRHTLAGTTVGVPALLAHLAEVAQRTAGQVSVEVDRKSTRLNSSHR